MTTAAAALANGWTNGGVIERFARLNSIALIDTATAEQQDLLTSAERSVRNPRFSPDRR